MELILNMLAASALVPAKELYNSMTRSKTLTIMVLSGLIIFGLFVLFLLFMADKQ